MDKNNKTPYKTSKDYLEEGSINPKDTLEGKDVKEGHFVTQI